MRRAWLVLLVLLLSLPAQARPRLLVVIADGVTLTDLQTLPGSRALMSPGLAHGADPLGDLYAAFGAGDSIRMGDRSQGLLGEALRRNGVRTALIGNADGDDTGPFRPAAQMLPAPDRVEAGEIPDPLAPGGRRDDPAALSARTQSAFGTCDLVVVHFGDFARLARESARHLLRPDVAALRRREAQDRFRRFLQSASETPCLLLTTPPLQADGAWDRLAVAVLPFAPAQTLTSPTTQTPGLIAARDVGPWILSFFQIVPPIQMTGAVPVPGPSADLARLDRQTRLNQDAQNPLFWSLGLGGAAILFTVLGLSGAGRLQSLPTVRRRALYALRLLAAWPLALLAAPLLDPRTLGVYLAEVAGLTALAALLPSPALLFTITAGVVAGDAMAGGGAVAHSVLSAYALSGIRFYGIGNEYMGLLLGGGLLAVTFRPFRDRRALAGWFLALVFVLSCPAFGAKAGGAITAAALFWLAFRRLGGQPLRLRDAALGVAAGFALVFLWAGLSHVFGLRRTHLETAVDALGGGRLGYIAGVTWRKLGLALRVALHPGTLLGLLGFGILGVLGRRFLRQPLREFLSARPRLAAVCEAGLWGVWLCLAFNDSGIVAAILLAICLVLTLLHGMIEESCDFWPWMSARSESGSPSPMS